MESRFHLKSDGRCVSGFFFAVKKPPTMVRIEPVTPRIKKNCSTHCDTGRHAKWRKRENGSGIADVWSTILALTRVNFRSRELEHLTVLQNRTNQTV